MTILKNKLSREMPAVDSGRPYIVTLYPRYLEIRRKGTKETYRITYESCFAAGARMASISPGNQE